MTAGCCRGFRAAGVAVRRSRVAVRRLRVVPGRTASFKAEEEEYALVMIKFFNEGLIELPDGTPQRAFIASMLACDRARITKKKLNGLCVGKKYLACARTLETAARRAAKAAGLAAARDRFLRKRMLEDAPAKAEGAKRTPTGECGERGDTDDEAAQARSSGRSAPASVEREKDETEGSAHEEDDADPEVDATPSASAIASPSSKRKRKRVNKRSARRRSAAEATAGAAEESEEVKSASDVRSRRDGGARGDGGLGASSSAIAEEATDAGGVEEAAAAAQPLADDAEGAAAVAAAEDERVLQTRAVAGDMDAKLEILAHSCRCRDPVGCTIEHCNQMQVILAHFGACDTAAAAAVAPPRDCRQPTATAAAERDASPSPPSSSVALTTTTGRCVICANLRHIFELHRRRCTEKAGCGVCEWHLKRDVSESRGK